MQTRVAELFRSNPHGWVIVGVTFVTLGVVFTARSSRGLADAAAVLSVCIRPRPPQSTDGAPLPVAA